MVPGKHWREHYCIIVLIQFGHPLNNKNPTAVGILTKGKEIWITWDEPKDLANVLSTDIAYLKG